MDIKSLMFTLEASADIALFQAVSVNSDGKAAPAEAGDVVVGVAQYPAATGAGVSVMGVGVTSMIAESAVTAGQQVVPGANGTVKVDAAVTEKIGTALTSGAAGVHISVLVK